MLSVYCVYSPYVDISSKDHHLLRDLKINDKFKDGEMLAAGASIKYAFDYGWFLTTAVDFQKINLIVGDAGYHQYDPKRDVKEYEKYNDYAGTSNEYLALSLGVGKMF